MPLRVNMLNTKVRRIKKSSIKQYLEKNRPHLRDMIDDFKNSSGWKINFTSKPNFMSSTDMN